MEHWVVALDAPGLVWPRVVRDVERKGQPLWLELDGEIRGVLLPAVEARRLFGVYTRRNGEARPPPASDQDGY